MQIDLEDFKEFSDNDLHEAAADGTCKWRKAASEALSMRIERRLAQMKKYEE